ncbi:MAG: NADPH-dependent oxidoreductase [Ignavibacteria bacterium]|nr:MAG: NADPH-dependent oxidoreductase [Ignavibacteria bacterium]
MDTIACISGTNRPNNYTSRALRIVADELQKLGARPEFIDARDLQLGFPGQETTPDAVRLQEMIRSAQGVILATPEYHGSFAAMTKLIIENLGFPSAVQGKPLALLGVASGRLGAIKSLEQLRSVCAHTGAIVMPGAVSVAGVHQAFDEDGRVTDPGTEKALRDVAGSLVEFLKEYVHPKQVLEAMVREDGRPWSASV